MTCRRAPLHIFHVRYVTSFVVHFSKVDMRAVEVTITNAAGEQQKLNMLEGNYAIRLKLATSTSCSTTVEFILHLMETTSIKTAPTFAVSNNPILMPTGFATGLTYNLIPNAFQVGITSFACSQAFSYLSGAFF